MGDGHCHQLLSRLPRNQTYVKQAKFSSQSSMGHKLTPHDVELYQRIDEVLHFIWDPIRVAGMPAARDEYRGYSPVVFTMVKEGADETDIGAYLSNVATEKMGLKPIPGKSAEVAAILVDWRDSLKEKYAPLAGGNA
jgi:hypothetical protein